MELWDVYDKDRVKTGDTIGRGGAFKKGIYHIIVHVCVFNSKNEMLIQQRQPFKDGWSNMWDITAGGSAVAGDSSDAAAERELFEEIGYKVDFSDVRPHFTVSFETGFDDYYLVEDDIEIGSLNLQYEEVQRVKWASKDEILSMIDNGAFVPYHKSLIDMCFDMRKRYGALTDG